MCLVAGRGVNVDRLVVTGRFLLLYSVVVLELMMMLLLLLLLLLLLQMLLLQMLLWQMLLLLLLLLLEQMLRQELRLLRRPLVGRRRGRRLIATKLVHAIVDEHVLLLGLPPTPRAEATARVNRDSAATPTEDRRAARQATETKGAGEKKTRV